MVSQIWSFITIIILVGIFISPTIQCPIRYGDRWNEDIDDPKPDKNFTINMENCVDLSFTPWSKEKFEERYWTIKKCSLDFHITIEDNYECTGRWPILEFYEALKQVEIFKNNETALTQHICYLAFSDKVEDSIFHIKRLFRLLPPKETLGELCLALDPTMIIHQHCPYCTS